MWQARCLSNNIKLRINCSMGAMPNVGQSSPTSYLCMCVGRSLNLAWGILNCSSRTADRDEDAFLTITSSSRHWLAALIDLNPICRGAPDQIMPCKEETGTRYYLFFFFFCRDNFATSTPYSVLRIFFWTFHFPQRNGEHTVCFEIGQSFWCYQRMYTSTP